MCEGHSALIFQSSARSLNTQITHGSRVSEIVCIAAAGFNNKTDVGYSTVQNIVIFSPKGFTKFQCGYFITYCFL